MDLVEIAEAVGVAIPVIITLASIITSLTKTRDDDVILAKVKRALNVLALNVHKNKNADDVDPERREPYDTI